MEDTELIGISIQESEGQRSKRLEDREINSSKGPRDSSQ